ncbi:MAG: LysM repeat protein [Flavobacteriales bacterium]|jgi:LysM repeat protein
MKKILLLAVVICCCAFAKACTTTTAAFQEFVSHQVKSGETVYSISKKYNVTEKQIIKLNPDAKSSIYEGLVLILPAVAKAVELTNGAEQEEIKFKKHRVKRKETLYSISKKYGVSQEAIKRFNKQLYSETLRKGDRIQIPLNFKEITSIATVGGGITPLETPKDGPNGAMYAVKAKETKYGVARMYGITIAQLEAMNPGMGVGLQEGTSIRVPKNAISSSAVIDTDTFEFYEVVNGDTMYSLLRRLAMKADDLVNLNPALDLGLKEGMILKIPKNGIGNVSIPDAIAAVNGEGAFTRLVDSISDYSTKRVIVMLPFSLKRGLGDSTMTNEKLLKSDRLLRLSLDFHTGILMAVSEAKAHGISVDLRVFDTEYARANGTATNARKIEELLASSDISGIDAVIGPVIGTNVNRAASVLRSKGIPVISPLTGTINMGSNVFQSRPSDAMLQDYMLAYLKAYGKGKNIVIIADSKNGKSKSKLKAIFPNAKEVAPRSGDKGYFLNPSDIPNQISETAENWVILETNDIPLISNVTTNLNTLSSTRKVTLFTTHKGSAYDSDDIQHMHLTNLKFHFPSIDNEAARKRSEVFREVYEDKYTISPSRFAIRGYDVMYDTLLRLAYAKDLYSAAGTGVETENIENKFYYRKTASGGFQNTAVYLMKYAENLKLEEVWITSPKEE